MNKLTFGVICPLIYYQYGRTNRKRSLTPSDKPVIISSHVLMTITATELRKWIIPFWGRRCYSIVVPFPSLCLSVCCVVYCGQTVQDFGWYYFRPPTSTLTPQMGGGSKLDIGIVAKRQQLEKNFVLQGIGNSWWAFDFLRISTH